MGQDATVDDVVKDIHRADGIDEHEGQAENGSEGEHGPGPVRGILDKAKAVSGVVQSKKEEKGGSKGRGAESAAVRDFAQIQKRDSVIFQQEVGAEEEGYVDEFRKASQDQQEQQSAPWVKLERKPLPGKYSGLIRILSLSWFHFAHLRG